MSSRSSQPRATSFEACNTFFNITELVEIFLNQCSTSALLNCSMVCRTWKEAIKRSALLQQHLFLEPVKEKEGVERVLNPMLAYFAPVLVAGPTTEHVPSRASFARTEDLTSLPWARNTSMHAPTRRAFARREASWRKMLVSQPPISRIDWWHEWAHDRSGIAGSWFARRIFNGSSGGWGHQDQSREFVTLGMLWDLVESRMTRGCSARIQFFLEGLSVEQDPDAHEQERQWIAQNDWSRRPYGSKTPRVKITTEQVWKKLPWAGAGFDMERQEWVTMPKQRPTYYAGDGFNTLLLDCHYDGKGPSRWSRSDGFQWKALNGESSGS
ncbi:hypothetical protein HBH56_164270 [Parastagonospora nodorum]|uniref:F-box domain-containing protein n=2 Tax=Phaeosphaeria nodorum (strain SN15 / ATCC MYA-4574 / FGSC 10173) TaxID=321614 RepID=A0A7U2IB46_PHANO|nr:hypothetical protein SNOG_11926 [Parastagonospora nodorum SN15]KAH3909408.1 hypothetical protein HBH56_164270 [Parastagonospora nodorum]EAT80970.1 hypothetical protein SNOG_11926 [Parastagonospora nodorum SN15]KAH3931999.1 hypothetical protein HBH54_084970 [Parastagonospora nodorum]KAH4095396.1 hypothetical protein HBH46_169380 [Parastagonospora nodorum]KAH4141314.1 hypothetical protein HBH45_073050 [Parastagonospora nodorum]